MRARSLPHQGNGPVGAIAAIFKRRVAPAGHVWWPARRISARVCAKPSPSIRQTERAAHRRVRRTRSQVPVSVAGPCRPGAAVTFQGQMEARHGEYAVVDLGTWSWRPCARSVKAIYRTRIRIMCPAGLEPAHTAPEGCPGIVLTSGNCVRVPAEARIGRGRTAARVRRRTKAGHWAARGC